MVFEFTRNNEANTAKNQNPNYTKVSTMLPPIQKHEEIDKKILTTDTVRVLGIKWFFSGDSFVVNSKTFQKVDLKNPTQGKILMSFSSIYDPIGFIAPFTVRSRKTMKDFWRLGKQWGKPLPRGFDATLESLITEIRNISSIEKPRFLYTEKIPTTNLLYISFSTLF